jgi:hypothetical protein
MVDGTLASVFGGRLSPAETYHELKNMKWAPTICSQASKPPLGGGEGGGAGATAEASLATLLDFSWMLLVEDDDMLEGY